MTSPGEYRTEVVKSSISTLVRHRNARFETKGLGQGRARLALGQLAVGAAPTLSGVDVERLALPIVRRRRLDDHAAAGLKWLWAAQPQGFATGKRRAGGVRDSAEQALYAGFHVAPAVPEIGPKRLRHGIPGRPAATPPTARPPMR